MLTERCSSYKIFISGFDWETQPTTERGQCFCFTLLIPKLCKKELRKLATCSDDQLAKMVDAGTEESESETSDGCLMMKELQGVTLFKSRFQVASFLPDRAIFRCSQHKGLPQQVTLLVFIWHFLFMPHKFKKKKKTQPAF